MHQPVHQRRVVTLLYLVFNPIVILLLTLWGIRLLLTPPVLLRTLLLLHRRLGVCCCRIDLTASSEW